MRDVGRIDVDTWRSLPGVGPRRRPGVALLVFLAGLLAGWGAALVTIPDPVGFEQLRDQEVLHERVLFEERTWTRIHREAREDAERKLAACAQALGVEAFERVTAGTGEK